MRIIRDEFTAKIQESAKIAVGAHVILQLGFKHHQEYAKNFPHASIEIGSGNPDDPNSRKIKYYLTHQDLQNKLNRNAILELYLTEIIQHWYDFLANIFSEIIQQILVGQANYEIKKIKLEIDLSGSGSNLFATIKESALLDFDFKKAKDKIDFIRKILQIDLASFEREMNVIKTNIEVRNILQHNNGVVKSKNLKNLGKRTIESDEGNRIKQIQVNQKITRTGYDIENLVDALVIVAKALIP